MVAVNWSIADAATDLIAVFGGLALGLLGLVAYEAKYMAKAPPIVKARLQNGPETSRLSAAEQAQQIQILQEHHPYRLAMMIAIGIGAHNFSEGLAVGQSYAAGSVGLALLLIVGFGAHNTTEGFGIAGPLAGLIRRPTPRFLDVHRHRGRESLDLRFHVCTIPKSCRWCDSVCFNADVQLGKKTDHKPDPHDRNIRWAVRRLSY